VAICWSLLPGLLSKLSTGLYRYFLYKYWFRYCTQLAHMTSAVLCVYSGQCCGTWKSGFRFCHLYYLPDAEWRAESVWFVKRECTPQILSCFSRCPVHFFFNADFNIAEQFVAQYSFLFVVWSPTCFGQMCWPSSGIHMQPCFNLELCHVVTTVVVEAFIVYFLISCFNRNRLKQVFWGT
jgi:hypothetical protein